MLDLVSNGRVEFGIGEGATRLELHGYGIPAKRKQELAFEAAEQIANMMVREPYPGFEGEGFSLHEDAEEGRRRGEDGFAFFRYAINALVANDSVPGRSTLWDEYEALKGQDLPTIEAPGIGTPAEFSEFIREFQDVGVDQIIFLQQGGKNRHEHICESLELFARTVLPEFVEGREAREAAKAKELAPYIEQALARRKRMPELSDAEIPVVGASRERETFYHKD